MMLRDLLLGSDEEASRTYCIKRFGVDPQVFGLRFFGLPPGERFPYRFDEGNLIWMKNRLLAAGAFELAMIRPEPCEHVLFTTLHCFFISLEENAEMLVRLGWKEVPGEASYARTKLDKTTNLVVRPIDSTALSVSQFPPDEVSHPQHEGE